MNIYVVDRIEGDFFILETENKTYIDVPKNKVSKKAKEGSILYLSDKGIYEVDEAKTADRRKKLFLMQDNLFSE